MVMHVPLENSDLTALVDDRDYDRVTQYRWRLAMSKGKWTAQTRLKRPDGRSVTVPLHRFVMGVFSAGTVVQSADRNFLNCRRCCLIVKSRAAFNAYNNWRQGWKQTQCR